MRTGGTTDAGSDTLASRLHDDIAVLLASRAALRDASVRIHRSAAELRQNSARIRADSQRLRGEILCAQLPRDPSCGAIARRLLEQYLNTATDQEIHDAKTVVSELVSNAFLHGKGTIALRVSARRGRVRLEVIDEGQHAADRARRREGGRGLEIVDELSLAWGAREGSTHVWAELPATGPAPDRPPTP